MAPWSAVAKVFGRVDRLARPNVSLKYVKRGGVSLLSHVPYVQFTIHTHSAMLHRGVATSTTHALHTQTKQNKGKHAACSLRCDPPARPPACPSAPAAPPAPPPAPYPPSPHPCPRAGRAATRSRRHAAAPPARPPTACCGLPPAACRRRPAASRRPAAVAVAAAVPPSPPGEMRSRRRMG